MSEVVSQDVLSILTLEGLKHPKLQPLKWLSFLFLSHLGNLTDKRPLVFLPLVHTIYLRLALYPHQKPPVRQDTFFHRLILSLEAPGFSYSSSSAFLYCMASL